MCLLITLLCPTLCVPLDCSPARLLCPWDSPGRMCSGLLCSPPGLFNVKIIIYWKIICLFPKISLEMKTLKKDKCLLKWKSLSHVQLFVTQWTTQSMEFSRPEYWSGQPFPSPGDLPKPGIEPRSPALQGDSLPTELSRKSYYLMVVYTKSCPTLVAQPHGLYPARLLCPWDSPGKNTGMGVAISFSRAYSQPRNWTRVSCIAGRFFTKWAMREAT